SSDNSWEVLVPAAPATLDPRFTTDAIGMRVSRLIHAGLVRLDDDSLEPLPYLAERWTWEGNLTLDLALRPGLRFASGAPLEAVDVCATLDALRSEHLASPHRGLVAALARCESRGPLALRLVLQEPRATLLTDLELPILRRDQAALPPGSPLDSLGPFALEYASESEIRLLPREGSPLPRPPRSVVVRVVRDETARATRLLAGRADIVPNAISPPMLEALVAHGALVSDRPGANLTYLLIHNQRPGLASLEVRRALGQALDRERLARTLLGGHARVAQSLLPPESWVCRDDEGDCSSGADVLAFDPGAARSVFKTAGVQRVTLLCSTDRQRVTMARAVAQMLEDAGLSVELLPLDLGVMLHRLSAGDFELAILQIPEVTEPNLLRWFFHSASIPAPGRGGANRARYASPQVDALLEEAARIPDRSHRRHHYRAALRRMMAELPVIPLFHEAQVAALSPRAASFRLSAEGRWLDLAR
ncbi:MAG: ABC transporter substrate-binding protein, partial [Polyangiaceae bacterium]|nr:ABC transporter substrate-binding protein [Polyangiaceae bacterium]